MLTPVLNYDMLLTDMRTAFLDATFINSSLGSDVYGEFTVLAPVRQTSGDVAVCIHPFEQPEAGIEVIYRRICASSITGNRSLVVTVDVPFQTVPTPEQIKDAVEARYGLVLDLGHFVLEDLQEGNYPGFYRGVIRFLSSHLTLEGQLQFQIVPAVTMLQHDLAKRIEIMDYYTEYHDDSRLPVEVLLRQDELMIETTRLAGDDLTHETLAEIMAAHTQTAWVSVPEGADFNLYDCTIVYNGLAHEECLCTKDWGHVLIVVLGPMCRNLKGLLRIHYREPKRKPPVRNTFP